MNLCFKKLVSGELHTLYWGGSLTGVHTQKHTYTKRWMQWTIRDIFIHMNSFIRNCEFINCVVVTLSPFGKPSLLTVDGKSVHLHVYTGNVIYKITHMRSYMYGNVTYGPSHMADAPKSIISLLG